MKKVVLVVLNDFTHDNRVLKEATSLSNNGYDVSVCALHEKHLQVFEEIGKIKVFRLKLKSRNISKSKIVRAVKYFEFMFRFARKFKKTDIIHCNDLNTLPFALFLKIFYNKRLKVVYDAHEHETQREYNSVGLIHKIYFKTEKFLIKYANVVITVSPSIAKEYAEDYNLSNVYLVHNCPHFQETTKQDLFRKELGISSKSKIFIYQGGLSEGRGLLQIIDAFKQIENRNNKIPKHVIIFMGYGPMEEKIKTLAGKHNTIFYFPPQKQEDLIKYTNSADWGIIFNKNISKNHYYSLPNKLFESIMADLPIIATPLLELSNIINENKIGIIAKDFSTEALVEAIQETNNAQINKDSFKTLKQKYNWESQEKILLEAYNEL